MARNVLLINGNPKPDSYCDGLAEAHCRGLEGAGDTVRQVQVRDLSFDPIQRGYDAGQELEPDLAALQSAITWADHLVMVYPVWWGTSPGLLKGLIDRVMLPGFGFQFEKGRLLPRKLLTGKSARLLVTMDSPPLLYRLLYRAPGHRVMRDVVLKYCGIKPVKITEFGPLALTGSHAREWWLQKAYWLGRLGL